MVVFRVVLIAFTVLITAAFPLIVREINPSAGGDSVYAAFTGRTNTLLASANGNGGGGDSDLPSGPASACGGSGTQMIFQTADGRVAATVLATMPQSVKITVRQPSQTASLPPLPGRLVDNLSTDLIGQTCAGAALSTMPAEYNVAFRYTDAGTSGFDRAKFAIVVRDPSSTSTPWRRVEKQSADPSIRYLAASTSGLGTFAVVECTTTCQ